MQWASPREDLRTLISDGPTDKARHRKRCLGIVNGTNVVFKTFETRRLTNFTKAGAPFGVYVGPTQMGSLVEATTDNLALGEFSLTTPPTGANVVVEATYYYQWFLDGELDQFLKGAAQWLGAGEDITQIGSGLQPAALNFAGHLAYKKIATRWSERWSETYLLMDAPQQNQKGPVDEFLKIASQMLKDATGFRDDYYQRQGQPLSPLYGAVLGRIPNITPMR